MQQQMSWTQTIPDMTKTENTQKYHSPKHESKTMGELGVQNVSAI